MMDILKDYSDVFAQKLWDALESELLFLGVDTSNEDEMRKLEHFIYPSPANRQEWLWNGKVIVSIEPLNLPSYGFKIIQHNCTIDKKDG